MIGIVPVKGDDKGFVINGWQFYVGAVGDEFYTEAKLVVEATKGGGQYGDPKVVGNTWRALAEKQAEYSAGEAMTTAQRELFLSQFIASANTAIATWISQNGGAAPEIPANFWGWLRWHFLNRVQFDSQNNRLVL